jgi:hypothetical protein
MANIDGVWDTVIKTPMGEQTAKMTITSSGDTFSGTSEGSMGNIEVKDGKIDGDTLTWSMDITSPMPMTANGTVTIDGDSLSGEVKAGMFSSPITGQRVG